MKSVWTKTIAMAIASALSVACFAGCGKEEAVDTKKIRYWSGMSPAMATSLENMGDMGMYKELEKKTGIQLEFLHPPVGQVEEQFNLLIASGESDLPDLIEYDWINYPGGPDKAISDGIILDLTELIEKFAPNMKKAVEEDELRRKQSTTDQGAWFGFPSLNTGNYRTFGGLLIRQDWLDELGLPMPETLEEWETTLKAFKEKKGAKAPLTFDSSTINTFHFNNAFDVGLTEYVDNGKFKLPQLEPGYQAYVETMNRWYREGLLDSEFDTNNSTVVDAKMTNGSSGVTYGFIGGTIGRYVNAMKDKEPGYKLAAAPFPVAQKGDEPRFMEYQKEATNPFVAVTSNCKDPESAVKMMDFFYTEEGLKLKNFGVEGETYNVVDGKCVYTDEILKNPDGLSIAEAMSKNFRANSPAPGFNQIEDYLMQYYELPEQREALQTWAKYGKNAAETIRPAITPTMEESEELISIRSEINTYTKEMTTKFIKGTEPLENYDKFVDQLISMGTERYVELNQQALDRYETR